MLHLGFYFFGWYIAVIVFLVVFLALVIHVAIAVWVYRDAQKRNMEAGIWVLILLLFSLLGIVIYLLVRDPLPNQRRYKQKYHPPHPRHYAPVYHQPYSPQPPPMPQPPLRPAPRNPQKRFCIACGKPISPDALFCANCGTRL